MFWGPGVFGYGTSLLWGSYPKDQPVKPFYSITVQPGSKTIRRKSDRDHDRASQGFTAAHANVWVQYASSSKWEEAPMQPGAAAPVSASCWSRVPEDVQYYVEAGGIKSSTFKLHTIDLPAVKNIQRHLQLPLVDRPRGDHRRSRRRSARGRRHRRQTRYPYRQGSEQRADCVRRRQTPIKLDATHGQQRPRPMSRSRKTARITSP